MTVDFIVPTNVGRMARSVALATVGFAVIVAFVGVSMFYPLVGVAVLALACAVWVLWAAPKAGLVVTFVAVILAVQLQTLGGAVGGAVDEGLIVLSAVVLTVRRMYSERSIVWAPGLPWFLLFAIAGVVGARFYGTPPLIWIQGALLLLKAVIFAFALAQVRWSRRDLERLAGLLLGAAVVMIVLGFINLVIPGPWNNLFANGRTEYYAGISALVGPFRQPAAYGRLAVILVVAVLAFQLVVRSSLFGYIVAGILGGLSLLTFRVKSLVGLALVSAGLFLRSGSRLLVFTVLLITPLLLVLIGPFIFESVFGDLNLYYGQESARSLLAGGGVQIAAEYFPLGVGFGRYGSSTAAENYSPEYVRLGFEFIFGLGREEGWGAYLIDTQWPALLGETGWLGTISYAIGALLMLRILLVRVSPEESAQQRWIRYCGVCWFALIMIDSVAAPVFSSPPSYIFLFAASGIVASLRWDARSAVRDQARAEALGSGPSGVDGRGLSRVDTRGPRSVRV